MFSEFLNRLLAPEPKTLQQPDSRLALVALLVRVARSDEDYVESEKRWIDRIAAERFDLSPFEAAKLRSDAERLEAEAPDTVRFTSALKEAVPYEDRVCVVEALWQVVLADGERDASENALLRLVSSLLGVNDLQSAQARQRVSSQG